MQLRGAASTATRFVPSTMNARATSSSGVEQSGRRGDGGRSAGVERAAITMTSMMTTNRAAPGGRATAQGGSRAAALHLSA